MITQESGVEQAASLLEAPPSWQLAPQSEVNWRKAIPLIVLVGLLAYANSFDKAFVFDDNFWIKNNPDISSPFSFMRQSPTRWVSWLTLSLNYQAGGLKVEGYHFVNWAIHICAALALFGIVRRTLLLSCKPDAPAREKPLASASGLGRFERSAPWLALAVALVWVVHPLTTQSVTYTIQRCESLMGLFYLLTVYCVLRGGARDAGRGAGGEARSSSPLAPHPSPLRWYALAVVCCAVGMGCKEVMVTAPVVVLLYDRVFLAGSWSELLRKRWPLHAGLAATWGLLAAEMMIPSTLVDAPNAGFGYEGNSPLRYAMTQPGVIFYYLRLTLWPSPLCLDYSDWPLATGLQDCLIPGVFLLAMLVGSAWALYRRPWLGFLGAWFFIILAPTSSIMPIADVAVEHRMYLSLASVVVLVVMSGDWALRRFVRRTGSVSRRVEVGPARDPRHPAAYAAGSPVGDRFFARARRGLAVAGIGSLVAVLATVTLRRNEDYRSIASIWGDAVSKRPSLARAHNSLGAAILDQGRVEEARAHFQEAVRLNSADPLHRTNLAMSFLRTGEFEVALTALEQVIRDDPTYAYGYDTLGLALRFQGKLDRATEAFRRAVELDPRRAAFRYHLSAALFAQGHHNEAAAQYEEALRLDPAFPERTARMAWRLALAEPAERQRTTREIVFLAEQACGAPGSQDARRLDVLAVACAADGQFERATATARAALKRAEAAGASEQAGLIAERVRLFEQKKPFQAPRAGRGEGQ